MQTSKGKFGFTMMKEPEVDIIIDILAGKEEPKTWNSYKK